MSAVDALREHEQSPPADAKPASPAVEMYRRVLQTMEQTSGSVRHADYARAVESLGLDAAAVEQDRKRLRELMHLLSRKQECALAHRSLAEGERQQRGNAAALGLLRRKVSHVLQSEAFVDQQISQLRAEHPAVFHSWDLR